MQKEKTLVLIKPDAVKRGLVGEILHRFERASLKVVALKMLEPSREQAEKLYPATNLEHLTGMGNKTLKTYQDYSMDPIKELGTNDPLEIGKMIREWNMSYITSGPIMAMILEGYHAVDNVRAIVGNTIPTFAAPGTVRGDFSLDSPAVANSQKRAIKNLVHATGTVEEYENEGAIWFKKEELHSYSRTDDQVTD